MQNVETLPRKLLVFPASLALWAAIAVLMGGAFAITGLAGIFVSAALASWVLFGALAAKFPTAAMGVAIWCLGLAPFNWGLETGVIPKLFGDEALLLLYLASFPFLYLFTKRSWQPGFGGLYLLLAVLLCTQALSFAAGIDLIAFRNFVETCVLGALLLVLFLQESSNSNPEAITKFVVGVTVTVAALSVVERIVQRNPIMEQDPLYLSPELARITEGVYRPYVTFFHPSEAGTFMALGVPFAVRVWLERKSWLAFMGLLTLAAGLFVNATRGVWVGVLIAGLLELRNALLLISATVPIAALGGWIGYAVFKNTPFMQRAADPEDLFSRLEMWRIAGKIFLAHPLLGVGHMQFGAVYLDYVRELSNYAHFDISTVFVADNMFITTIAEHGFLGVASLVAFLLFIGHLLRNLRKKLQRSGDGARAAFVRCCELALVIYVVSGCFADVQQFTKATKLTFILIGLGLAEGVRQAPSHGSAAMTEHTSEPAVRRQEA